MSLSTTFFIIGLSPLIIGLVYILIRNIVEGIQVNGLKSALVFLGIPIWVIGFMIVGVIMHMLGI